MTETQWAEEGPGKPLRKSLPKWVWFCGGGCLLALIAGVIIAVLLVRSVKDFADPVKGWAELQRIIPADDPPPPEFEAHKLPLVPFDAVIVSYRNDTQLQFQRHKGEDASEMRQQMFESETPTFPKSLVVMSFQDLSSGTVDIQGREIRIVRLRSQLEGFAKSMAGDQAKEAEQYMLFADVTPEGRSNEIVFLQIQRPVRQGELDDETLREMLAPFHIGPNR
jgi:hypothetical protein